MKVIEFTMSDGTKALAMIGPETSPDTLPVYKIDSDLFHKAYGIVRALLNGYPNSFSKIAAITLLRLMTDANLRDSKIAIEVAHHDLTSNKP